jgi:hypothetical protein
VQDSHRGITLIRPAASDDLPKTPTIDSLRYVTEEFLPMMVEAA